MPLDGMLVQCCSSCSSSFPPPPPSPPLPFPSPSPQPGSSCALNRVYTAVSWYIWVEKILQKLQHIDKRKTQKQDSSILDSQKLDSWFYQIKLCLLSMAQIASPIKQLCHSLPYTAFKHTVLNISKDIYILDTVNVVVCQRFCLQSHSDQVTYHFNIFITVCVTVQCKRHKQLLSWTS